MIIDKFTGVVFIGIMFSGIAIVLLSVVEDKVPESFLFVFAYGAATGWFFSVLSMIAFLVSALAFMSGLFPGFWKSMYPINLGCAIIGYSLLSFSAASGEALLGMLAVAIFIALWLHRFRFLNTKYSIPLLVGPIFLPNITSMLIFTVGVILITLPVLESRYPLHIHKIKR
ncbi:MAG: hypothetical protein R2932_48555 [Caldilineaceae bacterium]